MPRKTDKRDRLVHAAMLLIHRQGFNLTTLADIAQEADVPLGNVYYYFKTKEAIGESVIAKIAANYTEIFSRFNAYNNPAARLKGLVSLGVEDLENIARFGCQIGGLCQELGKQSKQGSSLADQAAKLLHDILMWVEKQFVELGNTPEVASDLALNLVSAIQGVYLLTNTFKDPKIYSREVKFLEEWIDRNTTQKHKVEQNSTAEEYA